MTLPRKRFPTLRFRDATAGEERTDIEALAQEIARLRAENEQLRLQLEEPEPEPEPVAREPRRVRVLLLPDPRPQGTIGQWPDGL